MNCRFCSAILSIDSLVCNYCGQRNPLDPHLSQSREKPIVLNCAECHTPTMEYTDFGDFRENIMVIKCTQCHGIFISFELLEKTIMHYGWVKKNIPPKIEAPQKKMVNSDGLYNCIVCDRLMKRYTYKISSSVVIDQCAEHGVWLNHGELKALIEWKRAIKQSKDKEAEDEAYKKYGLKRVKSSYTYQKHNSSKIDDFFIWLLGG